MYFDLESNPVRKSPAGVALGKVGAGVPPEDGAVEALRREAEVSCPPPPKDYTPCAISQSYCLFNVTADPCEFDNLAFKLPSVVGMLKDTMEKFRSTAVPRGNKPIDPRYNKIKAYP